MQTNPNLSSRAQGSRNSARDIIKELSDLEALFSNIMKLEDPELMGVIRAIAERFQTLFIKARRMEMELDRKENLLLRSAEKVQQLNITIREMEPNTFQKDLLLDIVADAMQDVEAIWEIVQNSKDFYGRLSCELARICEYVAAYPQVTRNENQNDVVADAAQDNQSTDGTEKEMEEGAEEETDEEMEEETDEEME
ncbi:hypothetical protein CCMA1212_003253 [Trichoderma ghanense]|uniref:Uncharacterized protein n=1 Tax=Trichoderma ghanense TaxID=65468 RepID=A0ABY2HD56_9HYPO